MKGRVKLVTLSTKYYNSVMFVFCHDIFTGSSISSYTGKIIRPFNVSFDVFNAMFFIYMFYIYTHF